MPWLGSNTSADAAAHRPRGVLARLLVSLTGVASGHVSPMQTPPRNGTAQPTTPDLTARAVRTCNRKPEAVEAYLRLHRTLGSKPSSETEIRP